MAAKNRLSLIFFLLAAAGFALLYGIETIWGSQIVRGETRLPDAAEKWLSYRISSIGTESALSFLSQIKFRWILLCLLAWWMGTRSSFPVAADENRLRWRIRLFFVFQILYIPDLLAELNIRWRWAGLFEPPLLSSFFLKSMPPLMLVQFCGLFIFGISAWLILSKWKNGTLLPAIFSFVIWVLWTFLLSIYQSGGVTDHTYASMHSGMFFMSAFLLIWWKRPMQTETGHRLFQAGIWSCYFFAGMEKIFISGISWLNPDNFSALCRHHPGANCEWFAEHPGFAFSSLIFTLSFQLLSPLQWQFPRWGYVTAAAGMIFHLATWLILGVGGWQSPWLLMLIFLLPVKMKNGLSGRQNSSDS